MTEHLPDFKAILEALPGHLVILAPDAPAYSILAISKEWLRATGQERDQVVGKSIWEVYPQNAEASTATGPSALSVSLQKALDSKQPDHLPVMRYLVAAAGGTGEARYCAAQSTPVLDEAGEVRYLIHARQDMTERKLHAQASEAEQAADLAGMRRLYELQAKLADQTDVTIAFQDVLALACEFTGTDRGCVQFLTSDGERLEMFVWQGYPDDSPFISFFRYEGLETGCEITRVQRQRLIIEDTVGFEGLDGTEAGAATYADDIRAAQSTPMTSRAEETMGVISTQFRQPHRPSDHELRLMDMLAWTAAEFLERHRAEAARRASEQQFRLIADAVPQIVWLTDADGRMQFFNKQWSDYTGGPHEPTTATEAIADYVHPDDGPATTAAFAAARATGTSYLVEHRIRSHTGDYRWFLVRAEPYREVDTGKISRWFGASVDIHDRKQAEEALRQNEARQAYLLTLSDALRSVGDAVEMQATVAHTALHYFQADHCYYGELASDTITIRRDAARPGLPSVAGVYSLSTMPIFRALLLASQPVVVADVRTSAVMDDHLKQLCLGFGIMAYLNVPVVKNGEQVGMLCLTQGTPREWTALEATLVQETAERTWAAVERARAEEALRESEALLKKAFAIDTVGVLFFGLDGGMTAANQAFAHLSGCSQEALLALDWKVLTAPEFWDITAHAAGELADQGETAPYEKQFVRPDGSRWWGLCAPTRLKGHGPTAECMEFIIDISERKCAEEQLRAFTASLETQVAERTQTLRESQELLLHLRLSRQQALFEAVQQAQEAERKRIAEGLHNGVGQLLFATKLRLDLLHAPVLNAEPALAAARHEADQMLAEAIHQTRALSHELVPTALEEFGLAAALQDVCGQLSTPQLQLRCHVVLDEDVAPLPPLLQLALLRMAQELSLNMVKHAHGATEASLELETTPGFVLLRAEDNGVGFTTDPAASPGLGLRIIRDRVALLNGTLDLGHKAGFGTFVRLRIPLPPAPTA